MAEQRERSAVEAVAEARFEHYLSEGLSAGRAFALAVKVFERQREFLCWRVGLPLAHKLDHDAAAGRYSCVCGWAGSDPGEHLPPSHWGDVRLTNQCYDAKHEQCSRIWNLGQREHGWCLCACHAQAFPLFTSEAAEQNMRAKFPQLGPVPHRAVTPR